MNERIYKSMSRVGVSNLVIGIVITVAGIGSGILLIINGAKLLKRRNEITI